MAASARKARQFERAIRGFRSESNQDDEGSVRVTVQLYQNSKFATGNINRTFTVANGRVSDVAAAIEEALFGSAVA